MVNLVAAQRPLLHALMKMAGVVPYSVDIEPGTTMNFWVPVETLSKPKKTQPPKPPQKPTKPVVVLVHGFAAEGIVTWQFQVGALSKRYSVYVPDLLFFGDSITKKSDRSPTFQAECLAAGLRKLGVDKCTVVGFSYGGMVAFKLAELWPELVEAMVVSGSILAMTDSISGETLQRLGFGSSSELLLPTSVKGLKALLSVAAHKKLWFPDRLHKDFLEVMFNNRKDRAELLEGLVMSNKDSTVPKFPQKIHLLWGLNDQIFNVELARKLQEDLGDNATFQSIPKSGHLVHLERPCVYNRCLKQFLATLHSNAQDK
ncbi:monoacylglycerol lipase ABHD6-like [Cucurbita moschata]|uniref:Monoacylglycerol lipase ABHD6-like n=1 Tax=Cucurbita moschata TaxID=3662 RepID=A0A6J1ERX3_CUCMO|nr:monoacylglycerol lipase ABHD6-like [Cucurbita moschata]